MMKLFPDTTYGKILVFSAYAILALLVCYIVFAYLFGYFLPFILAWIMSLFIIPIADKICKDTNFNRRFVCGVLVFLFTFFFVTVVFLISNKLFFEAKKIIDNLANNPDKVLERYNRFIEALQRKFPELFKRMDAQEINNYVREVTRGFITKISASAPSKVAQFVSSTLPEFLLFIVVMIMATYYMSADNKKIAGHLKKILPKKAYYILADLKENLVTCGVRYLRACFIILIITFIELFVGFLIIKIDYALLLAFIIAFLDMLPVLGVGTVLIPWILWLLVVGDYYTAFSLLILYFVITLIRQLIEPKIVGDQIGLNPLVTLVALYVGFKMLGIAGLILSPFIAVTLINFIKILEKHTKVK